MSNDNQEPKPVNPLALTFGTLFDAAKERLREQGLEPEDLLDAAIDGADIVPRVLRRLKERMR